MNFDAPYRHDPNHPMNEPLPGSDRDIPVDLGRGVELMKEGLLVRSAGTTENDNEIVAWVEYHLPEHEGGRMVHRSVHVHLKKVAVFGDGQAAVFG